MKERPIIFSGEMVRAILAGEKTQTRRMIKPQPDPMWLPRTAKPSVSPYGQRGDRLWVREAWAQIEDKRIFYRSDYGNQAAATFVNCEQVNWRPSIHMPRWASRITLEIVNVRVERLQDISARDAKAEGAGGDRGMTTADKQLLYDAHVLEISPLILIFRRVWESIHSAGSWTANPWVWVIEFKSIENSKEDN